MVYPCQGWSCWLILEVLDLSGKGNNLGVSQADSAPATIGHAVVIKDTQILDNGVLVSLFSCNPRVFCKTHIDSKNLVDYDLCSAKKLIKKLIVLEEVFSFVSIISC
jgi:hypothetical protein